jgi:VanZ family protein
MARALGWLRRFGPPVGWMAVIALLSGDVLATSETGSRLLPVLARLLPGASPVALHTLHAVLRKLGHLVEYGILAALWLRALEPGRAPPQGGRPAATRWAVGLSAAYAVLDEARQGLAPDRSASVLDVLLDAAGAVLAVGWLAPSGGFPGTARELLRGAALVIALGSLAAALVDWSLGLPAWDLLLAAVGAGAAVWGLGRISRKPGGTGRGGGPGDSWRSKSGV